MREPEAEQAVMHVALVGGEHVALNFLPKFKAGAKTELGIRPEFVSLGREGMPVAITKVEDIGRHKIVRARFADQPISIIVDEDGEIPADPRVRFDQKAINIYADSWRVGEEA